MESKKSRHVITAVVIAIIVTFAVSFLFLKYIPDTKETSKVDEYKKEIFSSTLCQYSCPLSLQTVQNQTEYLPEQSCVKSCTSNVDQIKIMSEDISNNQIIKDGLIKDMSTLITSCKNSAINTTTVSLNSSLFFSCSTEKLSALKIKYPYLN